MKVLVCGVARISGLSKFGSQFDMCMLKALRPIESFDNGKIACRAYGFESVDLSLDPDCLPQFSELRFPTMLDLRLEDKLTRKGIESFVVGFDTKNKPDPIPNVG